MVLMATIEQWFTQNQLSYEKVNQLNTTLANKFPQLATEDDILCYHIGYYHFEVEEGSKFTQIVAERKNGQFYAGFEDEYNRNFEPFFEQTPEQLEQLLCITSDILMESEMDAELF